MYFGNERGGPWDMMPHHMVDDDFPKAEAEERVTSPDLAAAASMARQRQERVESSRRKLELQLHNPSTRTRMREVFLEILNADQLLPEEIKMLRMSSRDGQDDFMEFRGNGTQVRYVYFTKDRKNPDFMMQDRSLAPIKHPGATALLKIDWWNEAIRELRRWEDGE